MRMIGIWVAVVVAVVVARAAVAAPSETVIYSFRGPNGRYPSSALIADASGALYGTTKRGGTSLYGTAFKLSPPTDDGRAWKETILFSFFGTAGEFPEAGLVAGPNGTLYGTTGSGGSVAGNRSRFGTVFSLTPPAAVGGAWTQRVLYSFGSKAGTADGCYPSTPVILDGSGAIYGTTSSCGRLKSGSSGAGTVFKLSPPAAGSATWTETTLYTCDVYDKDGTGGPQGLTLDGAGSLYGTTIYGVSEIFRLEPPETGGSEWTETVLHRFPGSSADHIYPYGSLIFDSAGRLYGTTAGGRSGLGNVYRLNPPTDGGSAWHLEALHFFQAGEPGGANPPAGLVMDSTGALYGTTSYSGGQAHAGTVFKLTPPATGSSMWTQTVLYQFQGGSDGDDPDAGLLIGSNGALYGTTYVGGIRDRGTVFQVVP